jgi:hypothetical protein
MTLDICITEGMQNAHRLIDLPSKLITKRVEGKELRWVTEFRLQVQVRGLGWLLTGRLHGVDSLNEQLLAVLHIAMPDSHRHLLNNVLSTDMAWKSFEAYVGQVCRTRLPEIKPHNHGPKPTSGRTRRYPALPCPSSSDTACVMP